MSLTSTMFGAKYFVHNIYIERVYIRMGITIFKISIWRGISSYIRSEIKFSGSAHALP